MHLALVPGYLLALEGSSSTIMSAMAAASAAGLYALGEVIARRRRAGAASYRDDPVVFGIATLLLVNSLTHLAVNGEAPVTTNLALLIAGASFFIRSARWLLPFIGLTLVGSSSAVALFIEDFDWLDYTFAVFVALGLSTALHRSRQAYLEGQGHAQETQRILMSAEAAEARSTSVIEALPDAVIVVDHEGRITMANPMAVEIFGYREGDLIGRTLAETIVPERLGRSHLLGISRYLESRESHLMDRRLKLPARRADGSEFPAELTLREVHADASSPMFVGFIVDLTERENLEKTLYEARDRAEQASHAKSQFLARMSHEIRTPLNAVVGLTKLAITELPPGRIRDMLERSHGAGEYLSAVLGDTLDLLKVEAGRLETEEQPLSPRDLLEEACGFLAIYAADRGLDLVLQIGADVPDRLVGDSTRIRQIVTNLVANAIKFTHRGWVRVSMYVEGDRLCIEVEDTGAGVPTALKSRIFEEFEQGLPSAEEMQSGAGLGLSISRRLAHLLDGVITLEDRPGGGSRFSLILPCVVAESNPSELPKLTVGRVIVALSQSVERSAIRENFSQWSLVVEEAGDPAHLREIIDEASCDARSMETAVLFDPETFPLSACPNPEFDWIAVVRSPVTALPSFASTLLTRPIGPCALARTLSRASDPDETETAAPRVVTSNKRILVVEDNEINQIVVTEMLRREGWHAEIANDGYEAIDMLGHCSFDALLMDISMPGMDGFQTLERIRSLPDGHTGCVVAVSAYATREMTERALSAGFDGFLPKPIEPEAIRRVLSEPPPSDVDAASERCLPGATQPDGAVDIIDLATLETHTEGDRELIRRLALIFDLSYPDVLRRIADSIASRDWEALRQLLHKLKGTLGDIGGLAASEIAGEMSRAGRERDADAAEQGLTRLGATLRATSERLSAIAAEGDDEA